MKTMILGTAHFVSLDAALKYYNGYFGDKNKRHKDVMQFVKDKLEDGEIKIGRPEGNVYADEGGRYHRRVSL